MKNKSLIMVVVAVLIVGAAAFYGGMQYQKSQRGNFAGGQFANRNGEPGGFRGQGNNRPVSGEIISQDDNSITVKMQDGSSKIVILSEKTTINKASTGTKSDLKTGERITAFGTANSDGSVTAENVSIGGTMFRGEHGGAGQAPSEQPSNQQ